MKKLLLILFAVVLSGRLMSQVVFCPPGAEWRYVFYNGVHGTERRADIAYTGDLVIGNEIVKILRYRSFFPFVSGGYCNTVMIKQSGDTVFMRNCNTMDTWQILYNFAALPGQSWITTLRDSAMYGSHASLTTTVMVNAVTNVVINNMSLKKLLVSCCCISPFSGNLECYTNEITERIGFNGYVFNFLNRPQVNDYETLKYPLCYKDNIFGVKEFSRFSCDVNVGIHTNPLSAGKIKVYPSPVSNSLSIDLNDANINNCSIKIVNTIGQVVLSSSLQMNNTDAEIDLSTLTSGIYFLQLFDNSKLTGIEKIIKE